MRVLTEFPEEQRARRLCTVLLAEGISVEVQQNRDGTWKVWLHEESQRPAALELIAEFERDPNASRFTTERARRGGSEPPKDRPSRRSRARVVRVRDQWQSSSRGFGRLTAVLIACSVVIGLMSDFGDRADIVGKFSIAPVIRMPIPPFFGLEEIAKGEVWRLLTPIFVHYTFLHLIFNMLWLKEFGAVIERAQSTLFLGWLVLVTGILSNVAQYFWSGPRFGGMSGVVYALLGYTWIRGRFDPSIGYRVPAHIVNVMLIWFVVCLTPLVPAANAAHAGGLASGALWGYLAARVRRVKSP